VETRAWIITGALKASNVWFVLGGEYDDWDIAVVGGLLGSARMLMAIEDHGAGTQYIRTKVRPRISHAAIISISFFGTMATLAAGDSALIPAIMLGFIASAVAARTMYECAFATGACRHAIGILEREVA
jgi:hypothetical protein